MSVPRPASSPPACARPACARKARRAAACPPLLLAGLIACLIASGPGMRTARAADFVVPPGQNVGLQEDLLRERVTRVAKDLAGNKVVSVVANVGYVRMDRPQGGADRVKLPGLNNFVTTSGDVQVSPEFVRVRQVVVVVSDELAGRTQQLERDIRTQVGLDPAKGDRLDVITVAAAAQPAARPGTPGAPGAEPRKGEAAEVETVAKEKRAEAAAQAASEAEALREPKSTAFLIQARAAYFRGDYNQALDQIMQSIGAKADNPQAYAMLGSLYYAMNWKNLALKYWEKALAQDPANRELEQLVTQLRTAQN